MEHRQDGHPAVEDGLPVCVPDGGLDLRLVGIGGVPPVVPGVFPRRCTPGSRWSPCRCPPSPRGCRRSASYRGYRSGPPPPVPSGPLSQRRRASPPGPPPPDTPPGSSPPPRPRSGPAVSSLRPDPPAERGAASAVSRPSSSGGAPACRKGVTTARGRANSSAASTAETAALRRRSVWRLIGLLPPCLSPVLGPVPPLYAPGRRKMRPPWTNRRFRGILSCEVLW